MTFCNHHARLRHIGAPLLIAFFLSLTAPNLYAKSPDDPMASAFTAALKGKQLFLRNFSTTPEQKFIWKDDHLSEQTLSPVHALVIFVPHKISGDGSSIMLRGDGFVAVLNARNNVLSRSFDSEPITIQIDLQEPSNVGTAQAIADFLFFHDAGSAVRAIPPAWQSLVPFKNPPAFSKVSGLIETDSGWVATKDASGIYKSPVLVDKDGRPVKLYKENPYAWESLNIRMQYGALAALVDASGVVRDVWILVPLRSVENGYSVAVNFSKFKFQPATLQDHPVRSIMLIASRGIFLNE